MNVILKVCEVGALYSATEGALYHHISLINHRFSFRLPVYTCVSLYLISVAIQMLCGVGPREISGEKW